MLLVLVVGSAVGGCAGSGPGAPIGTGPPTSATGGVPTTAASGPIQVEVVAAGLKHAWDLGFLPDGAALVTERPARIRLLSSTRPGARVTEVVADLGDVYVQGEGGLMGLVVHPNFAQTRRFTTCQTHQEGGRPVDVRLVTWELAGDGRQARRVADPLVAGLPLNPSGRHSGCRPTLGPDGALYVGTGDSATAAVSQDRTRLGGKVLRIDLRTGGPPPGNPFADSPNPAERLVFTYGHRNVQGVAVQPGTGRIFTAEHGPDVDDEINILRAGGNYGWDPSRGGSQLYYDERVPMTDLSRFPAAVPAVWNSGGQTEAICGDEFIADSPGKDLRWGKLQGLLAVTALKGSKLLLMRLNPDATVAQVGQLPQLDGTFGRLRAVRRGPDGALYVTTSNGDDDKVLRVAPAGA
ncbi:MAG TPA: PQQ-dependent sugar dehydrogenase [Pseudonocardiaceae bacterium]|jgi:glucose/arabinose dehydrogenase|nr:PQQ-dependent sugar dehydrogenase [Pseudonocardiaceae bacterium]